ncbi:MAG: sensory box histidine kinase/response regulator [Actinomycetia bacterium]|nr:sensory box histidine kinase/response regulator [Actinomycetes bacterium]
MVCGIALVAVGSIVIVSAETRNIRGLAQRRMQATASLTANYVSTQMQGLSELVAAYADRVALRLATDPSFGPRSTGPTATRVADLVSQLKNSQTSITGAFLTNADGILLRTSNPGSTQVGNSFRRRDWYQGAIDRRTPYVSEAYQSAAAGRPFVVSASVAVRTRDQRILGVLAVTYPLTAFQSFVDEYATTDRVRLRIVDQRNLRIADGGNAPRPGVTEADLVDRPDDSAKSVWATAPVGDLHWKVISAVPLGDALVPARGLRQGVLLAAIVLSLLLAGAAVGWQWSRRHRRSAAAAMEATERLVEEGHARLAAVVDSSADAIFSTTPEGTVTSWNLGAERVFGYTADEIMGLPIAGIAPARTGEQRQLLAEVLDGAAINQYETVRMRKDGQLIDVSLTISPMRGPTGEIVGASAIARDITETKRAAEAMRSQREQIASIIATASDAFVGVDSGGTIAEWNHQAETMFGWTRDEVLGLPLAETIIPARLRDAHYGGLARVLGGGETRILGKRVEVPALHKDGHEIPVELGVWKVQTGSDVSFNAFVRDIAERQQIQKDLADARDRALEASRLKSEFLATMSHEIRTPMNGVIGLTELLLDGPLDGTQRRYAEGIRSSGNALLAVINDILDFSKIEAGKLVLDDTSFDLQVLVEEVVELVSDSARHKGLELVGYFDPQLPTALRGDPVRIRQILLNLATNAVKFTDDGEVVVRATAGRGGEAGDLVEIRFEVSDTGIGIPPEDHERLFDPFAQADASTTRRFGGTGLGLAICRELTAAMGGQIGLRSTPGSGSTFWCVLPLHRDTSAAKPLPGPARSLAGLRVLVVDDNETSRFMLRQRLGAWQMTVDAVASGEQALERLWDGSTRDEPYDLALIDLEMPEMDGLELARRIRGHLGIPPLPVVLLSSRTGVSSAEAAEAGISVTLLKPVQRTQLAMALSRVVQREGLGPAPAADDRPAAGPVLAHGRLLLDEDNEINQLVALEMLSRLGYSADVAAHGAEALTMLAGRSYQAVLMDCQMPVMDGYEATGEIRRRESQTGEHVPVIAMTAAALPDDRERCIAVGMDDYVTKPIRMDELTATLGRWVPDGDRAAAEDPRVGAAGGPDGGLDGGAAGRERELAQAIRTRFGELLGDAPGSETVREQLVGSFLTRSPAFLADLAAAIERSDASSLAKAAHLFRGVAANLGAVALAETCQILELAAQNADLEEAGELLARITVEHEAVRRAMDAIRTGG